MGDVREPLPFELDPYPLALVVAAGRGRERGDGLSRALTSSPAPDPIGDEEAARDGDCLMLQDPSNPQAGG